MYKKLAARKYLRQKYIHSTSKFRSFGFLCAGWKYSYFSLISDFFTSTILTIIFKISCEERVSYDTMIDPDYQKKSVYYFRTVH